MYVEFKKEERQTKENGAHWVIAHENPVTVMINVEPQTLCVKLWWSNSEERMKARRKTNGQCGKHTACKDDMAHSP